MRNNKVAELHAVVVQKLFQKDNFIICICKTSAEIPQDAVKDILAPDAKTFIVVGYGLPGKQGYRVKLSGEWEVSKKYGNTQLKVSDCTDDVGTDHDSVVDYLSSGILKGVGKATAEKIYKVFGEDALDILENEPRRLLIIPGISAKRLDGIIHSFAAHQDMHLLTRMLSPYGVSYRTIVRIRKTFGEGAASIIKNNPYTLCRVNGLGFLTADDIAIKMGVKENDPERIQGAITYAMREAMTSGGHVFITREALLDACAGENGILNAKGAKQMVTKSEVDDVIALMLINQSLHAGAGSRTHIYLPLFWQCESFAAERVKALLKADPKEEHPVDWPELILAAEQEAGVKLADRQREAVEMALTNGFSIITGGPGSGKTTSLRVITQTMLKAKPDTKILLAAPTGRAARRMSEQAGLEASTIHSMLGLKPGEQSEFSIAPDEYLDADFIIIDETSMMDAMLFAELLYKIRPGTKLLFLGDADQLPSVGPGNVLRELLAVPEVVPHVKLDKVFRQGEQSIIPKNAAQIRSGATELQYSKAQFTRMRCSDEALGQKLIVRMMERLKAIGELDCTQLLCPMRRRGETSTRALNDVLHNIVNPPEPGKFEITVAGTTFRTGDKVMQTKNTNQVSNGDIGVVTYVMPQGKEATADGEDNIIMVVKFDVGDKPVGYTFDEALDLEPATAITIHKSQGGEFKRVIVPMFKSMSFFLRRNLLYTAITRAKEQVVLVSDDRAIEIAIKHEDTSKRNTELSLLLAEP